MLRHSVAAIQASVLHIYEAEQAGIYPNAFARLAHSGTLHNGPVDELKQKRFWSHGNRWAQFEQADKIVVVPKWLSDCSLNDLEPFFDN